jgi:hypothetical protein
MDIDKQAREAGAAERQHNKIRESAMDARAKAEAQQNLQTDDAVSAAAREAAASQRKADEIRQSNMQR